MARKNDGMTPRQRQSQEIMREKAARKKRKARLRKCYLIGGSALSVTLLSVGVWSWKSGALTRARQAVSDSAYQATARAGFSVQALYLEGRSRTSMDEVEKALAVTKGDPILRLSVDEMRERLEKIESVKQASVERALPDTLHVHITEREPVALWQHGGKLALVDDNGVVMNGLDITPYKQLPLILGDDAPAHVGELLAILSTQPALAQRFAAAIHVGERRWNIRLSAATGDAVEVRLPESNPAEAWKTLAELEKKEQLLDREIKMIDLRLPGRLFMKVSPDAIPGKANGAKDT